MFTVTKRQREPRVAGIISPGKQGEIIHLRRGQSHEQLQFGLSDLQFFCHWPRIARFASVGNTGFVVVVQQRYEDAESLESSTLWNLTP